MSTREDGVPDTIPPEPSRPITTFEALVSEMRDHATKLRDHDHKLREHKDKLAEGAREFGVNRTFRDEMTREIAKLRLELTQIGAAQTLALTNALASLRADTVTRETAEHNVVELRKELAARAPLFSSWKVAGIVIAALLAVGSPLGSAAWMAAKYPDRAEYRDAESRIRTLEARVTELVARLPRP